MFARFIQSWREKGWEETSADVYARAYEQYGGSVITHPGIIQKISLLAGIPLRFLAYRSEKNIIGAMPIWGNYIAGSRRALKAYRADNRVDMGNPEIILPLSPEHQFSLRHRAMFVSEQHARQVPALKRQRDTLSMLKQYSRGEFSRKFKYNQRRELRLLEESGAELRAVSEFTPEQLAGWYVNLFERRWGFKPKAHAHMREQLTALQPYLTGQLIMMNQRAIALQLLFSAESPQWISVEYINSGVDPEYQKLSPGSVLTFVNTLAAEERAISLGKTLRYSFGKSDAEYKERWCNKMAVYQI